MAFQTRVVTGILLKADNTPALNQQISFTPVGVVGDGGAIISAEPVEVMTAPINLNGAAGSFSVSLLTVEVGFVRYSCKLPNGEIFDFFLSAGEPITLDKLLAGHTPN